MPREIDLFGVLVPGILVIFFGSLLIAGLIDGLLGSLGGYRYVWHPALFRLAVFLALFAATGLLLL
ncbi:MAG TPA: DUF1656 domain-containing protein [Thiomonas arsenitoxydans]|jgi:hypothetical protein|uniref:DUF1656 domain-containing protein n=1 Tax=Thiomonas TaxID=32012 RepID=UPI00257AC9AE|nr:MULTISPECIES: DUF1656 domain-containing protein [Thiomonas]HML80452.1 DUF1656 domain-containing protein [Thiomonas arsenitoxydans]